MDILFKDTGDGGEFVLEGGDLAADNTFLTPLYISLFGGDCYYNIYETYESDNEFQDSLNQPITVKNLQKTEQAGKKAISEGLAESIEFMAYGDKDENINVNITITEPSGNDYPFAIVWENEKAVLKKK